MTAAYAEYQDSGITWLGEIPRGWRTQPLWTMFHRIKDVDHPDEEMLSVFREYGVVKKDSRDNLNQTAENRSIYQLVQPGWLITNRMKAWQGSVGISPYRGIVSGHYLCFAPKHDAEPGFLNWLFRSDSYADGYALLSRGVRPGQAEIDNDSYRTMPVLLPPVAEQRAIADFLNRETAQIDTLIAKQEALIATLRERRSGVVDRSIASAMARTTGQRLKHLVTEVVHGWSPQCLPWPADGINDWAVLKAGAANGGTFRPTENKTLPASETPRPQSVAREGSLLVSRANTRELLGSAAVVDGLYPRLMLCDKLYALTLDSRRANSRFVATAMGTRQLRDLIELEASGSSPSMQNVSQADIMNLPMGLPSVEEQNRALHVLDEQTGKIDTLIAKAERFIELAKERRAALITAAVTGQIRVPT